MHSMKDTQRVKIGMIGLNGRGQHVIRGYAKHKKCEITAICDRHPRLIENTSELLRNPDVHTYTDATTMLREADIDAVIICTEPDQNSNLVCEALAAGKHVMCEVPLCYTLEDCWKMVLAVERSGGLKFQLAEQMRYHAAMRAWSKMHDEGAFGKITLVRGEYLHPTTEYFWMDAETGAQVHHHQVQDTSSLKKGRLWTLKHPIWYLPHELSPLLSVLKDRVTKVSCIGTRKGSYVYDWFPHSDIEVATMHTEKDTILNLSAGFIIPNYDKGHYGYHWYQMMGTKGNAETPRTAGGKGLLWFADSYTNQPTEMDWAYDPHRVSREILRSGHGGLDYWPISYWLDSILEDTTPPCDIYTAVETAAPAIVAGLSADLGGELLYVPDFRPGEKRQTGCAPQETKSLREPF
jgi:predicted dehydrogenase